MDFWLNDSEYSIVALLPHADLADLAVELDVIPEAEIKPRDLLSNLVPRLLELASVEGLPLSKWDRDDLEALPDDHRAALARTIGCGSDVAAMLKAGKKVYKSYQKERK